MRLLNGLFVLLVNSVPLYGVTYLGWSVGTVLLLYWLENLLIGAFTCARIALHRSLTRKSGHWRAGVLGGRENGEPNRALLLNEYIGFAIFFTLAQGLFVAGVVFVLGRDYPQLGFSGEQILQGAGQMVAILGAEFAVDAWRMRSRSFAWIKTYAQQRMGRVVIIHLTIIFGIIGMAVSRSPLAIVYALIVLKTVWDLAARNAYDPPAWLLRVAEKIRKAQGTDEAWRRDCERSQRYALADEQVKPV